MTKVVFNSNFASARPNTCYRWFYTMSNLSTITDIKYLNTSMVTNMSSMFYGCSKLKTLDLGTFDTQKVTTMYRMFYNCSALNSLQLYSESSWLGEYADYETQFVTKKATNLQEMFCGCSSLTKLVLAHFTVTSSTNTSSMLKDCSSLQTLYFDEDMSALNDNACYGVGTASQPCSLENPCYYIEGGRIYCQDGNPYLEWKKGFFVDGLRLPYVLYDGESLVFKYDLNWVTDQFYLNSGTEAPKWLDYASNIKFVKFDESFKHATPFTMYSWFKGMSNLTSIEGMENLNPQFVQNMDYFVQNMDYAFSGCKKLTSLDLSAFQYYFTIEETDMSWDGGIASSICMLQDCSGLKTLTVSYFANNMTSNACTGVGTKSSPCTLVYPNGFKPEKTSSGSGWYMWKSGYFKDAVTIPDEPDEVKGYAVLSGTTLTFYYDDIYKTRSGTVYDLNSGSNKPAWNAKASTVKTVVFDESFFDASPTSTYYWFGGMTNLTAINDLVWRHDQPDRHQRYRKP